MDFSTTDYLIKMYSLSEDWITGQEYTFVIKGTVPAGQNLVYGKMVVQIK